MDHSSQKATQDFLPIEEVRDDLLIMKDKSLRGIMVLSSLNFALKSAEEQEATIFQFQNFLNSLDFPCQILVQSRRLNMTGYLEKLNTIAIQQTNPLLKVQTQEYKKFIEELVTGGNIMTKNFFVVISFYLTELIGTTTQQKIAAPMNEENFQRAKHQIFQRMEFVALGLQRCGLKVTALKTVELIELFWSLYHPKQAEQGYYPEIPPDLLK